MTPITEAEFRGVQLDVVSYIDRVARKHGIDYSVSGGTLLGAIRHKGYIPWDDDIDIMMTRPNYEKLMTVLMANIEAPYELIYYKHSEAYLPFAKVYDTRTVFKSKIDNLHRGTGIFVDIFPMDVLPKSEPEIQDFKSEIMKDSFTLAATNPRGLDYASASRWLYFFGKVILWLPKHLKYKGKGRQFAEALDQKMQQFKDTDNPYRGFTGSHYKKDIFPREMFDEYEDVLFEDRDLMKVKHHDTYLKQLFSDYMVLPPKSEQINHHYYKWYWK
jgi:lipopolysaccharide cholinephosphotransferase